MLVRMESELVKNLTLLGERFCAARGIAESTAGRLCAADGQFFSRIRSGRTFTAKKYDEVVGWFSVNWPTTAEWPAHIARPEIETGSAVA